MREFSIFSAPFKRFSQGQINDDSLYIHQTPPILMILFENVLLCANICTYLYLLPQHLTISNVASSLFLNVFSSPFASTPEVLSVGVHAMPSVNFFVISTKSSTFTYLELAVEGQRCIVVMSYEYLWLKFRKLYLRLVYQPFSSFTNHPLLFSKKKDSIYCICVHTNMYTYIHQTPWSSGFSSEYECWVLHHIQQAHLLGRMD